MITSPEFWLLVGFLPICYWLLPARWRPGFLGLASAAFVAALEPVGAAVIVALVVAAHLLGRRARGFRFAVAFAALAWLAAFKYLPPMLIALTGESERFSVLLPLGISYFTFKLLHFVIETGRGTIRDAPLADVVCWIFLFPTFTAGPIERLDHFRAHRDERFSWTLVIEGGHRIVVGLIKRFVVVDMLLWPLTERIDPDQLVFLLDEVAPWRVWGICGVTYIVAWIDFSAYTDIALGSSRLFGLRIQENFDWPILATSPIGFWRRWHISLSQWCQTYVYMPMIGLTRRPYVAIFATFIVIGVWHAGSLSYLVWGLWHAAGVVAWTAIGRAVKRRGGRPLDRRRWWPLVGVPLTALFVTASFAFPLVHGSRHGTAWDGLRVVARLVAIDLPPGPASGTPRPTPAPVGDR